MIHHEKTCVKSPIQSLANSKCSINIRDVFDDDDDAASASLCPREPLALNSWLSPSSSCNLQAHPHLTSEASI